MPALLPRSSPRDAGTSSRALAAFLTRLEATTECHSVMVVRHGRVVAEGWWAPYSADQPHLLYSLTKTVTALAVGLAVGDGALSLDDTVVDVLPDHVPPDASAQARRLTVHHLLSMTAGHESDTLGPAWDLEPSELVRGFLRVPPSAPEGTRHTYDNATTFVLARMVERATGTTLPELLDARVFHPMGIEHAEWDRVASGATFGFHGLHLTTEAVAAVGELLRRGGRWGDDQLVPRDWVDLMTREHVPSRHYAEGADGPDFLSGYGYQVWLSRHGFHGHGAFGQHCVVVPARDLVVVVTSAQRTVEEADDVLAAVWDLLPDLDEPGTTAEDAALALRSATLTLPVPHGTAGPRGSVVVELDATADGSALPDGGSVTVEPADGGWVISLGPEVVLDVGHETWRESAPLGRPVRARGAWQSDVFVADVVVVTGPHTVRLTVDRGTGTATATWTTAPLTSQDLRLHLRAPLMTRPDVS